VSAPVPEPRVPLLSAADAAAAGAAAGVPDVLAELNVFRALLHHPSLARRFSDLLLTLLGGSGLAPRLRELVIMRLGWATGSVYEWTQHWPIALRSDVTAEELLDLERWRTSERFGAPERAVLAATDDVLEHGAVGPKSFAALQAALGDDAELLVEVVSVIATWHLISTVLRSLEVPLEDGVPPWPPDGRRPIR
jgi:alkylhydroperoxidase family enzyme